MISTINTNRLKGRIKELGLTRIAKALNLSTSTVNLKLNGLRPMSLDEAEMVEVVLHISNENFGRYFCVAQFMSSSFERNEPDGSYIRLSERREEGSEKLMKVDG